MEDCDVYVVVCPQCDNPQDEAECYIGQLGWLRRFRCRYCGMPWSES